MLHSDTKNPTCEKRVGLFTQMYFFIKTNYNLWIFESWIYALHCTAIGNTFLQLRQIHFCNLGKYIFPCGQIRFTNIFCKITWQSLPLIFHFKIWRWRSKNDLFWFWCFFLGKPWTRYIRNQAVVSFLLRTSWSKYVSDFFFLLWVRHWLANCPSLMPY